VPLKVTKDAGLGPEVLQSFSSGKMHSGLKVRGPLPCNVIVFFNTIYVESYDAVIGADDVETLETCGKDH